MDSRAGCLHIDCHPGGDVDSQSQESDGMASAFFARNRHDPEEFKLPIGLEEKGSMVYLAIDQHLAKAREEGREEERIKQERLMDQERKEIEQRMVEVPTPKCRRPRLNGRPSSLAR